MIGSRTATRSTPPGAVPRASAAPVSKLAWRNLWRQRRRTLLLLLVVAYATLAIIFFWGFTDGFVDSVMDGQARYIAAPAMVQTRAHFDDPDPENALADLDGLLAALRGEPRVAAAAPRLEFPALLQSPYANRGVQARGVDPTLEPAVSALPGAVADGRFLEGPGEIVLGVELAEELDVRLGERLAVDVASVAGPQAAGLTLVGVVDTPLGPVDQSTALVHLEDARSLTGVATATGIALDVPRGREAAVAESLGPLLPTGVRAYPLADLLGPLQEGLASERAQMLPLGLLFSLFAAVTVTSTVVVSVMERTREFGVMIALGLDQNRLGWMVTLEAVYTTLIGYGIGAVAGYLLLVVLNRFNLLGSLMSSVYGGLLADFGVGEQIYAALSAEYLLYAGITIALAAIFAALTPARRVRTLEPSRAMRAA